jgi:hypothetical protein
VTEGVGLRVRDGGSWSDVLFLRIRGVTRSYEIFLSQEILMRVDMMDCKSMATPMETNLKKLSDSTSDSDLVDPTMYRNLIGSLMYWLTPGWLLSLHLDPVYGRVETLPLGCTKACVEVPAWYSWIWLRYVSGGEMRL